MTGAAPAVEVPMPRASVSRSGWALARVESARFVRHPLFVAGVATAVALFVLMLRDNTLTSDRLDSGILAIFVGLTGMIVAFRRTKAMGPAAEVVGSTPMSSERRTAALVAACIVPLSVGLIGWGFTLWSLRQWPLPEWVYGALSRGDVVALTAIQTINACLGGAVLGVAAARWLRFRGAPVALLVVVVGWVIGVGQAVLQGAHVSTAATALRFFSPFAFFQTTNRTETQMETFPGSVGWFAAWQLSLCALAVVAALLKGSEGAIRHRILVAGWVVLVVALTCYVLAVRGGPPDIVTTFPDGTWVLGRP